MEESGENWPSDSDLEGGDDDIKDSILEEGEFVCDDDEGHSFSETGDPMVRKTHRKGELTERLLLALSATIPGLKKMDDTSILDEATNHVKQLQKRVRELEQKRVREPEQEVESNVCSSSKGTTTCKMKSDDYHGTNDILPEVKASLSQNEVLVKIHCEIQKGIIPKILSQLGNLHLSVVNINVLQFGKSILVITIIAKMGDGYNMTVDELVKTMRIAISTQ